VETTTAVVLPFPRYVQWGHRGPHEHVCPAGFVAVGRHGRCKRLASPPRRHPPFPIVGAKDPFDYIYGR
jgi:hypothetical protein